MKLITQDTGLIDLGQKENGGLLNDTTLQSAVIISLLSDRRAHGDDILPDVRSGAHVITMDRRGWCGDMLDDEGIRVGSRLWLLSREKQTEETRARAEEYCHEALQWLLDDSAVNSIDVVVYWASQGRLEAQITLNMNSGEAQIIALSNLLGGAYVV